MLQQKNAEIDVSQFEDKLLFISSKCNKENALNTQIKQNDMNEQLKNLNTFEINEANIEEKPKDKQIVTLQAKTCRYIPLRSGIKQSLSEDYQYRQIDENTELKKKGDLQIDQLGFKEIYKYQLFDQQLDNQIHNFNWKSKNLFHYDIRKQKKQLNSSLLLTYNNLMELQESLQNDSNYKQHHRKININPIKVLDAPQLQDDFYLNLIDWSSQNILSVALQSSVYLWSAINNKVTKFCDFRNTDIVCSLTWAPQGNQLAIGTESGSIQIYDQQKMKRISTLQGHTSRVGSLAWAGQTLCSGSKDKSIQLYDLRQQKIIGKLEGHKQEVCGLKWSPDEYQFASGGNDNKLLVWRLGSQVPIIKFNQHQAAVKAIAWSPHKHGLLCSGGGTADRAIRFFNTSTTEQLDWIDTGSQVCNLLFSKTINEFISTHGYSMNQIICWKYPTLEKVSTLIGHTSRVLFLAMSPDGETIVTGAGDETLRFWNIFPKKEESQLSQTLLIPSKIR
ncbi:unnamed protein product [Paramecium pentaurelia]|uniref:CDC20/Fizzy WD40 domain-containing protein n=1 Tax=Paramecium pentaurelia TaxID=43138 RepID=A0A8S1VXA9_9CILI|nr:unnamed protein product [Paramecium pentaurelia]